MLDHAAIPQLTAQLIVLARQAGDAIMEIYNRAGEIAIESKADDSPLTLADTAAHCIIAGGLQKIINLPMISEEAQPAAFAERKTWSRYWLIDPLDGTKEFILRSGEFTVNIALVEQGVPTLGVVHVPAENITYLGVDKSHSAEFGGAWKYDGDLLVKKINVRALPGDMGGELTVLASHRHGTERVKNLMLNVEKKWRGALKISNAGSSLKFCLIAEGKADFYPRLAPTSEWDTAAAQAVLNAAGGAVVRAPLICGKKSESLLYNQRDDLLNPDFYALGDVNFDWQSLLSQEPDGENVQSI